MGSLIVKKTKWDAIPFNEAFDGSLRAHVARFFEMIHQGLRLKYLARSYLYKRSDNDSFMDKGLGHRYKIAIDGYDRLADTFFNKDSLEAFHIRRTVRNEVPWIRALLNFKLASIRKVPEDDILLLEQLAAAVYRERSLLKRAPFLIYKMTPLPVARVARAVYKVLKPWLRARSFR